MKIIHLFHLGFRIEGYYINRKRFIDFTLCLLTRKKFYTITDYSSKDTSGNVSLHFVVFADLNRIQIPRGILAARHAEESQMAASQASRLQRSGREGKYRRRSRLLEAP